VRSFGRAAQDGEVAVAANDDELGIWAAIVWTLLALGVVYLIALFSKFPG
jgi:hypothetical protein